MTTLMQLQKKLSKNLLEIQQTKDLKGGNCPPPIDEGSEKAKRTRKAQTHM